MKGSTATAAAAETERTADIERRMVEVDGGLKVRCIRRRCTVIILLLDGIVAQNFILGDGKITFFKRNDWSLITLQRTNTIILYYFQLI